MNWPKNLFTKHNFQQKIYLPNIFSAKKNLMRQTERVHQAFCIKHVLIQKEEEKKSLDKKYFSSKQLVNTILINKKKCFFFIRII